ncbi:MAG: gliding motility-associated C-terminal domain-containing protein [Bacteroidota bacterium]|nr:gliding motility-associated C-terminal domain-containing protein [Bacteroidota bacterium]
MFASIKINCFLFKAKRVIALFALLFSFASIKSQIINNYINNFSFEDTVNCPNFHSQIYNANKWYRVDYVSTPDYFNSCSSNSFVSIPNNYFGKQTPRTGNGMAGLGFFTNSVQSREHIAVELSNPLIKNRYYCVTFYLSFAEKSRIAISNLGVIFKTDSIKSFYPVHSPPNFITFQNPDIENLTIISDTLNWIKIQGVFLSLGSEKHMAIGNFRDDVNTNKIVTKTLTGISTEDISYYFIDDVSVIEINPAKAANKDTVLVCANSTYTLGTDSTVDANYQWQPITGLSCTNCPNPVITVTNNVKYVLTKQQCSATTKDSVVFKIYNPPLIILPLNNATICVGNTTTLSVDSNPFFNYTWQPNVGLSCTNCPVPTASPLSPITYTLTKSACGFSNTATIKISIKPDFTLTPQIILSNTIHCLFDTLYYTILNAPNGNDVNYNWQPQNLFVSTFTNTAKALIQNNNYYFVTINNSNNGIFCPFVKKDSIYISLPDTCIKPLIIPTIFTPNYDNVNDVWKFTMPFGTKLNAVYVYNRWGALIYNIDEVLLNSDNSKIKTVYWDGHTTSGEVCSDGIYFYFINFEINGEKKTFKGNITLIR